MLSGGLSLSDPGPASDMSRIIVEHSRGPVRQRDADVGIDSEAADTGLSDADQRKHDLDDITECCPLPVYTPYMVPAAIAC